MKGPTRASATSRVSSGSLAGAQYGDGTVAESTCHEPSSDPLGRIAGFSPPSRAATAFGASVTISAGSLKIESGTQAWTCPCRGQPLPRRPNEPVGVDRLQRLVEGAGLHQRHARATEIPVIGSGGRRQLIAAFALVGRWRMLRPLPRRGGAGSPMTVVGAAGRGRPPQGRP